MSNDNVTIKRFTQQFNDYGVVESSTGEYVLYEDYQKLLPKPMELPLHPATQELVNEFAKALAWKLAKAEKKYGYSTGWMQNDWMNICRAKLMDHITKGDPLDVAAYCAFLWYHHEPTAKLTELGDG